MPDTDTPRSRWTPEVVLGLLALLASMILPYLDVPTGVATACGFFAAWLLGPLPSPLTRPGQRGSADVAVLMLAAGLVAVVLALGACVSTERHGRELRLRLEDDPRRPPPACLYRFTVDGALLHEGAVDECPAAPVCAEPRP